MTVDPADALAAHFEEHRAHLRAVAYRMLGSLSEADDAVQEDHEIDIVGDPARLQELEVAVAPA